MDLLLLNPLTALRGGTGEAGRRGSVPGGLTCGRDELVVVLIDQGLHVAVQGPDLPHHVRLAVHQLGQGALSAQLEETGCVVLRSEGSRVPNRCPELEAFGARKPFPHPRQEPEMASIVAQLRSYRFGEPYLGFVSL